MLSPEFWVAFIRQGPGVPASGEEDRRAEARYLEKAQTLRQNQVSLSHIYLSASVWLPASPQRKLSSGLCSTNSRYRMARKRGQQTHVRERERLLLNAISGHWKRSLLWCSLMYGLIWASTVVRISSTGLEFTKLMMHIKSQNFLCFVSLLDCGRIRRVHFLVLLASFLGFVF